MTIFLVESMKKTVDFVPAAGGKPVDIVSAFPLTAGSQLTWFLRSRRQQEAS